MRTECIRERAACRRAPSKLCTQRPGFRKDPGLFAFFRPQPVCASARAGDQRIAPPGTVDALLQLAARGPRYWPMVHLANLADVAQQAECDHAMVEATSSRLVIRSTSGVSFHSVAARDGGGGTGCARPLARSRAARHHIRRDARVWAQPKWISIALVAQQAEQPPCKRQAAFEPSPRAPPDKSRSSRRPRTPLFQGGYAGSSPARDASTRNPRRAHASGVQIGRNDWAAPEPVTGWILCLVNSVARVPVCLAARGARSDCRDSSAGRAAR